MNKKHCHFFTKLVILSVIIVIIFIFTIGCSQYQKAVVTKMGTTFSFEYPDSYQDTSNTLKKNSSSRYTVDLGVPHALPFGTEYDPEFGIIIRDYYSPESHVDFEINAFQSNNISRKYFTLIERSSIKIDNITAEFAEYKREFPQYFENITIPPIHIEIAQFIRNDLLWTIEMSSSENTSSKAKADFEHIIKTFKFID